MSAQPPKKPAAAPMGDDDGDETIFDAPWSRAEASRRFAARPLPTFQAAEELSVAAKVALPNWRDTSLPRTGVGFRAVPAINQQRFFSPKVVEVLAAVRGKVRAHRDAQRQNVWDKLDAAKRHAEAKAPRVRQFDLRSPRRAKPPK